MVRSRRIVAWGAGLCASLLPAVASAHAFGQQYTLPIPFSLYAVGAGAALTVSFVALLFMRAPLTRRAPRDVGEIPTFVPIITHALGIVMLVVTIVVGFFGPQGPTSNLAPFFFWLVLLLGVTYLSVFVAGVWRVLDPFAPLVRFALGGNYRPFVKYPERFGRYPALVLYIALVWLELLSGGLGAVPVALATLLLGYIILSLAGSAVYGVEAWFEHVDFFNVFFGLIEKFAPLRLEERGLSVAAPAERLVAEVPRHLSVLFFIIFMLASTSFDGLKDTQPWNALFAYSSFVHDHLALAEDIALLILPAVFFGLYTLVIYLMRVLSGAVHDMRTLLVRFTYSLIPIAIAYNFAHYFTLLLNGSQNMAQLLSDPFGIGWNLFGTATMQLAPTLIGAKAVWYTEVIVIVLGHIVATYVAHRIALEEFKNTKHIVFGQLPMLLLMVFYTVFGLWILSLAFVA